MQNVPAQDDLKLLTGSNWVATPGDYSSSRWLRFAADGSGQATFGYGQTIYAKVLFGYALAAGPTVQLTYLPSSAFGSFQGFEPIAGEPVRSIRYTLAAVNYSGVESVTGFSFVCGWLLTLAESPWPLGMSFPRPIPTEFYGHRVRSPRAKQ
jgi:hypothetical protein